MNLKRYKKIITELGFEPLGCDSPLFVADEVMVSCLKLNNKKPNWWDGSYVTKNGSFATKHNRILKIQFIEGGFFVCKYEQNFSNVTEEEFISELSKYLPLAKQLHRENRLNNLLD
ncbi:MAG: hypothetical protein SLAVMIC_00106 [uncultured marine phage]|uniref:Uncharacterized protein n=1 Tax=uncultured marine phage TaxID=707152 RepID=A0A8D9CBI1_9VIRU|nr:MAG: hypothetical protein SLAVMIC_00106 [uncultured marine phage]